MEVKSLVLATFGIVGNFSTDLKRKTMFLKFFFGQMSPLLMIHNLQHLDDVEGWQKAHQSLTLNICW